jgi:hypothetical protein
MKSPLAYGVLIGCLTAFTGMASAVETQTWPWNDKAPVDPALALLTRIDTLKVAITELKTPTLGISVEAQAPTTGFSEVK